ISFKDYYKVLEVDYDATDENIKLNYRRLALKWHPDKHKGDNAATAKFQEINEAYTVLSDPAKRLDYDLTGTCEIHKYSLQGMDPSSHIFHRIQMKYLNDDQDIRNYFSAFHLYHTLPAAVLIDDFPLFFHNNKTCQQHGDRDFAMAKTLALCHNAITYANQKGSCKLLLSDTHTHQGDIPRFNFIYKKWIHTTFTIQEGDVPGSFILKDRSHSRIGNRGGIKAAKYSVALQYLVLDGIIDDQVE
ncbi:hypothetical protein TanjilG_23357, partial [Lupinus angustifolius]